MVAALRASWRSGGSWIRRSLGLLLLALMTTAPVSAAVTVPADFTATAIIGDGLDPTQIAFAPTADGRIFFNEKVGKIRVFKSGGLLATPFFDLNAGGVKVDNDNESGLIGIALDPAFTANHRVYVYYTVKASPGFQRVSCFTANGDVADSSGETVLFESTTLGGARNHTGGHLVFGHDGKLYAFVGNNTNDGGSGSLTTTLGKVLRLNADGTNGSIPTDNPFYTTQTGNNRAIYAYGFRNPYSGACEPQSPWRIAVNDVGGNGSPSWEEVNILASGAHFGWDSGGDATDGRLNVSGKIDPLFQYCHSQGDNAIVGGAFYPKVPTGSAFPATYLGQYFFADYGSAKIRYIDPDSPPGAAADTNQSAVAAPTFASGFSGITNIAVGPDNALYVLDSNGRSGNTITTGHGRLWKITYSSGPVITVNTASPLPATTVGVAYTQTFAASGGTGGYTWSLASGTLPAGLTLSTGGVLSGTSSAVGTSTFIVSATAGGGGSGSKSFMVTVNAAPTITTTTLPNGLVSTAYSSTLTKSGGTGAVTWSLSTGTLPAGLTLNGSTGVISGTPTTAATSNFTVKLVDEVSAQTTKAFSIVVGTGLAITSVAPTSGNVSFAYTYDVNASGTPVPTFSLTTMPSGMTINATTGVISWTPSAAGAFNVTVVASNGVAANATQSFAIVVTNFGLAKRPATTAYLGMPTTAGTFPALLSGTGIFSNTTTLTPATSLIPYGVNLAFWSDSAIKTRWLAVPDGQTVTFAATGEWAFPKGTVFVKHFDLVMDETQPLTSKRRLETRILVEDNAGGVYGVTYKWNAGQTDADVITAAQTETLTITTASGTRTQDWYYPSPGDCLSCHTSNANYVLGVKTRQLNGNYTYPSTVSDNQLRTWSGIGLFNTTLTSTQIAGFSKLSAISDTSVSLELRARSYFDANCAQCHRPGGANAQFDARFDTALASQGLVGGAVNNALGLTGAKVIAPGDLAHSVAYLRIHTTDAAIRMPPIGRRTIDDAGATLLANWIGSLNAAPTITNIADRVTTAGTSTGAVGFTIGDSGTPPESLVLTKASSDTGLVPLANIILGGTGANRTVTVTPMGTGTGTATITITVADGNAPVATAADSFVLTVNAGGTPPPTPAAPTVTNAGTATPTFSGTTTPGATVNIYDGTTLIGTTTANGSGAWSWTPTTPLPPGTYQITITSTTAGGTSAPSANTPLTVPGTGGGGSGSSNSSSSSTCGLGSGVAALGLTLALLMARMFAVALAGERRGTGPKCPRQVTKRDK